MPRGLCFKVGSCKVKFKENSSEDKHKGEDSDNDLEDTTHERDRINQL